MKKNIKRLLFLVIFLAVLIVPYLVFAQETANKGVLGNMDNVGKGAGFNPADETTVSSIAGTIVSAVLGFLGVIFLILLIYAGFLWMTAQGNDDQVSKAKTIIKNSIIGLILIITAYGIYAVIEKIITTTSGA